MKKILVVVINLLAFSAVGQDVTTVIANYNSVINGKSKKTELIICNGESIYKSIDGATETNKEYSEKEDEFQQRSFSFSIESSDKTGEQIYINYKDNNLVHRRFLLLDMESEPFLVNETVPRIDWQLENETKNIGSFKCQKAIASFRGRNYIAWFIPEISVNAGPYKFQGLPGLIAEIYDNENFLRIQISDMQVKSENTKISYVDDGKKISLQEYEKLREKQVIDVEKHIQSKLPRGATFSVTKVSYDSVEREYEFEQNE